MNQVSRREGNDHRTTTVIDALGGLPLQPGNSFRLFLDHDTSSIRNSATPSRVLLKTRNGGRTKPTRKGIIPFNEAPPGKSHVKIARVPSNKLPPHNRKPRPSAHRKPSIPPPPQ